MAIKYYASGTLAYTTTYHLRCPYCQRSYAASDVYEKHFYKESYASGTPLREQVIQQAEAHFRKKQQAVRTAIETGRYTQAPEACICPTCGFVPAFLIPKGRYRALEIGTAVIGIFLVGSCLILSLSDDVSTRGLLCSGTALLPFLLGIVALELRMRPNRKLIRKARAEGRTLDLDVKPNVVFSPIRAAKMEQSPSG